MTSDFVRVQLTPLGREIAGEGPLRVHEGRHEFTFNIGEQSLRVTKAFDWERVLKQQHFNGHPLFQLVTDEHDEELEEIGKLGIPAREQGRKIIVKAPRPEEKNKGEVK